MLAPILFVIDSFSLVDVVCDVVFLIRIVNLSSRRPVSLQKNAKQVWLWSVKQMNIEGPLVKAVPESVRRRPTVR